VKPFIHFAHGNGFPSPCYQQLFNALAPRFELGYIERVGHDINFPITDNWDFLVDEVLFSIQAQTSQPVIAVGHSLGGVLSLLAAFKQPELFKAIILLDSPLLNRFKSTIVQLSKKIGLIDSITPAKRTRNRRTRWDSREEVIAYLKRRTLFKHFTPECLNDYVEFGLRWDDEGYSLRFDPEIEYQIFRTIPHVLHQYKGSLKIPTVLVHGAQSFVVGRLDRRYMHTHYGIINVETPGTHMFPMEHPDAVAQLIGQWVDAFSAESN
jgi:pimeloyl-ACP methyl ester carboxylesterase